jgi:hypothetical protein
MTMSIQDNLDPQNPAAQRQLIQGETTVRVSTNMESKSISVKCGILETEMNA